MSVIRIIIGLAILLPGLGIGDVSPDHAEQILDEFAYGLQYAINHETAVPIAAPPENPVRVEFADGAKTDVTIIQVERDGEHLFDIQDLWMWASVKGSIIDASRSEDEEAARRELANASGVAYRIAEPRILFTEGAISLHGWAIIDGARVECLVGNAVLTNAGSRSREYRPHFSVEWAEGTICKIGMEQYRRTALQWVRGAYDELLMAKRGRIGGDDPNLTSDAQGLEKLRHYVAGETTFGTFQDDFGRYFNEDASRDPSSVPGYVLKPLYYQRTISPPQHMQDEAQRNKHAPLVSEELQEYVSGIYVFGFLSQGVEGLVDFRSSPESFNVVAALVFENGKLASIKLSDTENR